MALSFTLRPRTATDTATASPSGKRRTVLVTGASGRIGSYFVEHAAERYALRLMVRGDEKPAKREALAKYGEIVTADLSDLETLKQICQDIDTIVHLAANPDPSAVWSELLPGNIVGTYNLFAAAKVAGCRRVIYASSIHAVSGYPTDVQVKPSDPVNPGDLYGVTKCFGEALARYMAEREGVDAICLRIGAFQSVETAREAESVAMVDAFVSQRDLHQLIERCIDDDTLRFALFHAVSDNRFKRLDISNARELVGYMPQDDFTDEHPHLRDLRLSEAIPGHNAGDPGQQSGLREETGSE